jgi:crotonobetainyl-CoA:carnitine CoA-transferase CaiB-like acyl-CoA transferase
MHLTGEAGGDPYKLGFAIVDVVTGLYAANAVLAGLLHQMQTGEGIHLKTSLYESAVAALINQGGNFLNGGSNPKRMGNHHPNILPYGLYHTATFPIIICVGTPEQYHQLCKAISLP